MASVKIEQVGAFQLEAGQAGGAQSPGWGESGSEESLGANDAFPWVDFGKGKTVNVAEPNEITSEGFQDIPVKVTEYTEKPLSTYARFAGLGAFNYWMWGFENSIVKVAVFTITTPSVDPTAGAVYDEEVGGGGNGYTFLREETWGSTTYLIFRAVDSAVPAGQSGTLYKQSGTGDATLAYTAVSALMYEHLYELDAHERHLADYRTAEQISGWGAGDKKNRMATLGIKLDTNDFRYKNAMCKKFGFSSSAGELAMHPMEFVAYDEERADYSSASWTFPATFHASDNIVGHHQLVCEIGTAEGAMVAVGVTNVEFSVDIPLQIIQDTISGTHLAEPVMEGKYGVGLSMALSRHSADTYLGYRDAWTTVIGRVAGRYGYYMQEFLFNEMKVPEAGPNQDDVPKENLRFAAGYSTSNNWSSWLYGNTLIQDGPVCFRVRNLDSVNHMFEL